MIDQLKVYCLTRLSLSGTIRSNVSGTIYGLLFIDEIQRFVMNLNLLKSMHFSG